MNAYKGITIVKSTSFNMKFLLKYKYEYYFTIDESLNSLKHKNIYINLCFMVKAHQVIRLQTIVGIS